MKKTFHYIALLCAALTGLTACDDFFETNPDNVLNNDDYIARESEMYRGYLGIITRLQEVGDQAVYLTDTRCDYLETTGNAPVALQNIGNYEPTDGNEYADPTGYYNVIVSCNDFITKMGEFYTDVHGSMSDSAKVHFPRLISSTLRLKVWAYYMLGRIYGEAYWYDSNLTDLSDLSDTSVFEHLDMQGICDKAIDLLDNGIDLVGLHIPADLEMDWNYWVDPTGGTSAYTYWKYMTPPWLVLRAELASWRASYEDDAAAKADWQWVRDHVLAFLSSAFESKGSDYYSCTMQTILNYSTIFYSEEVGYEQHLLGAIFYSYQNKQYNRLVQYLCPTYPGDGYYLRPSDYAQGLFNESDLRGPVQMLVCNTLGGETCLSKFYYTRVESQGYLRTNIFEIEPTVILFRGHDLHFLLAEAENHLGHWEVAETLLNNGILNRFPGGYVTVPNDSIDGDRIWSPLYEQWFAPSGGYGDIGIAGGARGTAHDLPSLDDYIAATYGASATPEQQATAAEDFAFSSDRMKQYDLALADEYLKEFTGEGKSYSYLVKMAERYGHDYTVIFDRVKGKYDASKQAQVRSSLQQKYFIDWNLNVQ
jgi:hypothetical protein